MAARRAPHPLRNHPDATRSVADLFWALAIGAISAYAFFAALGAFSPGEVLWLTIVVAILIALWIGRTLLARRGVRQRDPRLVHARERRGF
jgi:TRAP-type C4-dicarboxylate transport system permease large subunit